MKRRKMDIRAIPGATAKGIDDRLQVSTPLRRVIRSGNDSENSRDTG